MVTFSASNKLSGIHSQALATLSKARIGFRSAPELAIILAFHVSGTKVRVGCDGRDGMFTARGE